MRKKLFGALAAAAVALVPVSAALADGHGKKPMDHAMPSKVKGVAVENAWARASAGMVRNGGAYLTIVNGAAEADRLVGAEAGVAERVEIHTHIDDNGVMRMRRVEGVDLPAGGTVELKPGGYHVMFMGLHKPLKKGEKFPMTLVFEKAGKIATEVEIMDVGSMRGGGGHGGGMKH